LTQTLIHQEYRSDPVYKEIRANLPLLRSRGQEFFIDQIFSKFVTAVACLKHPAFHEEREWRAIHFTSLGEHENVQAQVESIAGVPQIVYKLPLESNVHGIKEMDFTALIHRVIVGPTQFPVAMGQAFIKELEDAKVSDPEKKVHLSLIPLRT
jgi:hypothetical protein